ncbi:trypsin-like peptidase domain-containing protein [Microtetraspora sp. AC03309]|uniref:trypsin-like serine peptidase n=1 Tax=Microtetraspora sp. AC03309 TaxID=2779376 RepID=UPI001E48AD83|nr:trypsin-like peptidase domain-containing protein [Microtetraspora sp. AC03309]MCC5579529.1 trypsin-like peptidase domain-containing protein [Microtetraspora sp. AC03309]
MRKRLLLPLGGLAATGLLAAALVTPATAAPTVSKAKLASPAKAADIIDFWTADSGANLKAAKAYGAEHKRVPKHVSTGGPAADGKPGVVPAIGDEKKTGGKSKNVNLPKTVGRAFFVIDGDIYACSASSIQSQYRNLVATAGHCVYDIDGNSQTVDRWVFVPGYYDGKTPFGVYVGKQAFTHYDFDVYEDGDRDYAFVTVYNGIGYDDKKDVHVDLGSLGKNVGGQGFAYNQKVGQPVYAFGYPAAPHSDGDYVFTGEKMKWCYGKPVYPIVESSVKVEEQIGLKCSMTGGSSGGPWILKYNSNRRLGYINGVTSLGGDTDGNNRSDMITSAYFDGETYGVYKAALPLWSGSLVKKDGSIGITETR